MTEPKRVLRPAVVAARMGVSESTFWRRVKHDPSFPRPFKLGGPPSRTTVVDEAEFEAWLIKCQAASNAAPQVPKVVAHTDLCGSVGESHGERSPATRLNAEKPAAAAPHGKRQKQ